MKSPEVHVPLSAAVFAILLALADGEKHGYGIMKHAGTVEGGNVTLGPGTLYGSLDRMVTANLVEETGSTDNERRRYYRLTKPGIRVLSAETDRLQAAVRSARRKGVLQTV